MDESEDILAALALIPEQIPAYARGVAGSELRFARGFPVYVSGDTAVLVVMPAADALSHDKRPSQAHNAVETLSNEQSGIHQRFQIDAAIAEVCGWAGVKKLVTLGTARPLCAPPTTGEPGSAGGCAETRDQYLALDLPYVRGGENFAGVPGQKLRNMLRRADQALTVGVEPWNAECQSLAKAYAATRPLSAGTRYIFEHLTDYASGPGVNVFTGRLRETGELHGLCVGDFTPLATALYMFAFRKSGATPGTADLLLHALVLEAQRQGHERVNLGLSVNDGIGFFKRKWGARPFLPLVECSWTLPEETLSFSVWTALLGFSIRGAGPKSPAPRRALHQVGPRALPNEKIQHFLKKLLRKSG